MLCSSPAPSLFPCRSGSLLFPRLWGGCLLSAEVPTAAVSLPGCVAWHKVWVLLTRQELLSHWAAGIITLGLLLPLFLKTKSF